jgi:hypothetical protein
MLSDSNFCFFSYFPKFSLKLLNFAKSFELVIQLLYHAIKVNNFSFVTCVSFDMLRSMSSSNINVNVHVIIKVNDFLATNLKD